MRANITTTTTKLIAGPTAGGLKSDSDLRSYVLFSPASEGTVLLKPAASTSDPAAVDMSDAARWNFSLAMLAYTLEPGQSLFAKTSSGDVDLDILEGGER